MDTNTTTILKDIRTFIQNCERKHAENNKQQFKKIKDILQKFDKRLEAIHETLKKLEKNS